MLPSNDLVLKKLRDCFPDPQARDLAHAMLETYGPETTHGERERVHLAALMQCASDLERLQKLIESAIKDYRDILVAAEYPEEIQSPENLSSAEMIAIRKRDRDRYLEWLRNDKA